MSDSSDPKPKEEFLLTFSDLVSIIRKNKKKFISSMLICASLAFLYGVTKPIMYEAEGTFKEEGRSPSGLNSSLSATFFMLSDASDGNALSIMRSRRLVEDLIKDQGLQGHIIKVQQKFPLIPIETIKNNLLTEYALLTRSRRPILKDVDPDFKFEEIVYRGEVPIALRLYVLSPETFAVYDQQKKLLGEGTFGQSFKKNDYAFTLLQAHESPISHGEYELILLPLAQTAKELSKFFTVEGDRIDKGILKITYRNRDRKQAAAHINALMALYQHYIECKHEQACEKQVKYLIQRQNEMAKVLETMMEAYAVTLSTDLSSTGFASSEKAMDFLASNQHQLKQKLFAITLEIQRLERAQLEGSSDGIFSSLNHIDTLDKLGAEKRQLKQQADSLDLMIRSHPNQTEEFHKSFAAQLEELDAIKQTLQESQLALASLQRNEVPSKHSKLADDSKYIFSAWRDKLAKAQEALTDHPPTAESKCQSDWEECKSGLISYLTHLNHYLNVYQRNIEEKLAHQQTPSTEFQGINLNIARELYISYNRDLSLLESRSNQHEFILSQLDEPTFEISSLSTILNDPLSTEMIAKTSNVILALKDQDNRSTKEQERLNIELDIQKGFLQTHIEQSMALLRLHQSFLKEKIQSLQSMTLSLIQEEISILDHHIKEYISNTLGNLQKEKELIADNLAELRMEMAAFPQKWAAEQLIHQQMEVNKSLVAEVSKLVESKNIANNLEKLQSAPVDIASPPLHPKSPHLFMLTVIGAALGGLITFAWTIAHTVIHGIPVSSHLLKTNGLNVCGPLHPNRIYQGNLQKDPLLDTDLSTLRRLTVFMESNATFASHACLLLEGKGPNYASSLAELLARRGLRTLVLELRFDETDGSAGVLQYLEGKVQEPFISSIDEYDKISTGGVCRLANELICSHRFKQLISSLTERYDWVLVNSSVTVKSAEADALLDLFPLAAITVQDGTIQDLQRVLLRVREEKNVVTFLTGFIA